MINKWTHLHSGSNVKLLTLAAAAKQPSILPSPEQTRYSQSPGQKSYQPAPCGMSLQNF